MLIKFNLADRAEKTVGSTGTRAENLLRQVKEERDNSTQTQSVHSQSHTHIYTHTHFAEGLSPLHTLS